MKKGKKNSARGDKRERAAWPRPDEPGVRDAKALTSSPWLATRSKDSLPESTTICPRSSYARRVPSLWRSRPLPRAEGDPGFGPHLSSERWMERRRGSRRPFLSLSPFPRERWPRARAGM